MGRAEWNWGQASGNRVAKVGVVGWEWWHTLDATGCEFPCLMPVWTPARLPCPVRSPPWPPARRRLPVPQSFHRWCWRWSGHSRAAAQVPIVTVTHRRLCSASCCSADCTRKNTRICLTLTPSGPLNSTGFVKSAPLTGPPSSSKQHCIRRLPTNTPPLSFLEWRIFNWPIACHPIIHTSWSIPSPTSPTYRRPKTPRFIAFRCHRLLSHNPAPAPSPFPMGVGLSEIWKRAKKYVHLSVLARWMLLLSRSPAGVVKPVSGSIIHFPSSIQQIAHLHHGRNAI